MKWLLNNIHTIMKWLLNNIHTILLMLGLVLIAYSAFLITPVIGYLTSGVLLVVVAFMIDNSSNRG